MITGLVRLAIHVELVFYMQINVVTQKMLIKILKLKYTLIPFIFVTVMVLTGLISYAQDSDVREGEGGRASTASFLSKPQVPQAETIQDLVIPAVGNEPPRIEDASGKIAIEGKISQLEQKVNSLIYLNAILLLLIIVPSLSFGIVKIRKKFL